ncbi:MAG: hypothetical protein Q8N14_04695, partial [Candidatus Omnitrophota bacterium]|nr:hypothetical protein [Candidatus Omnitrophota bacterium]
NFLPQGAVQDGKTRFTIARGNTEAKKEPKEDDFIPRLSGKPKIDIAPVYPDAALIALSENAGFMRATYFVKDDIDKVSEFYKNKMLNYGWSLTEEKMQQAVKPAEMAVSELDFSNKEGDLCIIALTNAGPKQAVEDKLKNTTTIMVQYEKAGK